MWRAHVVAANRRAAGPAARYSAYLPSASFSWSRESNSLTPCSDRNSAQSFSTLA
jgi:hypothetical protein